MASPFSAFRKYQKVLIAVFGVLLMIAFLVADPLAMMTGGGSGRGGGGYGAPVTFKGGSLSEEQLMRMNRADMLADELVHRVKQAATKDNPSVRIGDFPYVEDPRMPYQFREPRSEARLVRNYLLATKAHEMGLSMSNENIDEWLFKHLADRAVSEAELKKIRQKLLADDLGSSIVINEREIYAQLRINFLAQQVLAMVRNSTQPLQYEQLGMVSPNSMTLPPAEAWELFRRTARQATVELLPLEVEKFVDQVKTVPTERQKNDLFEKHKDDVPAPHSPDPGFATPHKIAFGYIRVDFKPFLDKAEKEITEEAIRAEYDQRAEKGELTVPVEKDEQKPDEGEPDEDGKPEDPKPDDSKPEDGDKPSDSKPDDPKPDEVQPEEKDVKDEDPSEPPGEETPPTENADEDELDDESQEPEEGTDDEVKPDDAKPDEANPDDAKPDEVKPDDAKPDDASPDDAKPDETKPDVAKPDDKKPEVKKPEVKKEETRVKTYEEMEDIIRTQLAQKPAQDAQREALNEVFQAVEDYRVRMNDWEIAKETAKEDKSKAEATAPEKPELLASIGSVLKKYSFEYKQTPLADAFDIQDEEIGKATIGFGEQSFSLQDLYRFTDVQLYQAFPAFEGFLRDTTYVLWKEQDQPQQTADRKAVDEELAKAVKLQEAFKLAKAEAERLASQAREKGDESLHTTVGGVENAAAIVTPRPFSWYSSGFAPGGMGMRLQPTDVPEVPYPGDEFMQTVLDLQPGEVGVAPDMPQKRVYVIRLVDQTPEEDILRQMFLVKGIKDTNVSQQYNAQRLNTLAAWMDKVLSEEMQLKWNRPPRAYGQ